MSGTELSLVIPVLDEAERIEVFLADLAARFPAAELVVVDGGSRDATVALATSLAHLTVHSSRGRARQSNAGAALATGRVLMFLHADTRLPDGAASAAVAALGADPDSDSGADREADRGADRGARRRGGRHEWGRFDVRIAGAHPLLPTVARCMNLRSRLTGVATGDQAMFVARAAFDAVGGFPDIALMEDVALSKRLRRRSSPACLRPPRTAPVVTSGRRWDANGAARTVLVMWLLRLGFVLGVPPARLEKVYGRLRSR